MGSIYTYIRLLSLDVAVGAVAGGHLASLVAGVQPGWNWYLILMISVWLVYTLDHLLDARRLRENASTPRHTFHFKHFRIIGVVWLILLAIVVLLAVLTLPVAILFFGLAVCGFVLLHLILIKVIGEKTSVFLVKEGGVAMVYILGIWGIPWVLRTPELPIFFWQSLGIYFLLALINLLLFSSYEIDTDTKDHQTSFIRATGVKFGKVFVVMLFFLTLALMVWQFMLATSRLHYLVFAVLVVMLIALLLLLMFPGFFKKNERYRALGDGTFMFPLVLFILQLC